MPSTTRRLLLMLCVGLLVSGGGAAVLHTTEEAAAVEDDPGLRLAPPSTTTTTVAAPVTTVATTPRPQPVRVPRNPYAAEPIVEIGTIEIPKIGLNHRIWQGISLRNIDNGPSHWPGTALPGQIGNSVFAGHRVTHSHPFRNIDQLVGGDEVIFTIGTVRSTYVVTGAEVVSPKALHIVDQTPTATATLFACHPPGSAKFRYVVHLALKPA